MDELQGDYSRSVQPPSCLVDEGFFIEGNGGEIAGRHGRKGRGMGRTGYGDDEMGMA